MTLLVIVNRATYDIRRKSGKVARGIHNRTQMHRKRNNQRNHHLNINTKNPDDDQDIPLFFISHLFPHLNSQPFNVFPCLALMSYLGFLLIVIWATYNIRAKTGKTVTRQPREMQYRSRHHHKGILSILWLSEQTACQ